MSGLDIAHNNPPPDIYEGREYQAGIIYIRKTEILDVSKLEMDKLPIFIEVSDSNNWFLVGTSKTQQLVCKEVEGPFFRATDITEKLYLHEWSRCDSSNDHLVKMIKAEDLIIELELTHETNLHCDIANECYWTVINNLKYLLNHHNASINFSLRDDENKTPLIIAAKVSGACDLVINYMLNQMLDVHPDVVKRLNIDAKDDQGRTALHYLCAYGMLNHVKKLIELGANINLHDENNMTPFDFAHANREQLQFLLGSIAINGDRPSNFYTELGGHSYDLGYDERAANAKVAGTKASMLSIVDVILSRNEAPNFIQALKDLGAMAGAGSKMLRGSYLTYAADQKFLMERDVTFCLQYELCVTSVHAKNVLAKKIQKKFREYSHNKKLLSL